MTKMDLADLVSNVRCTGRWPEVAVVVLVIFLMFLLHWRSALAPALTLPLRAVDYIRDVPVQHPSHDHESGRHRHHSRHGRRRGRGHAESMSPAHGDTPAERFSTLTGELR